MLGVGEALDVGDAEELGFADDLVGLGLFSSDDDSGALLLLRRDALDEGRSDGVSVAVAVSVVTTELLVSGAGTAGLEVLPVVVPFDLFGPNSQTTSPISATATTPAMIAGTFHLPLRSSGGAASGR